jgi:tetratricopeptide (TPR) repeat protein
MSREDWYDINKKKQRSDWENLGRKEKFSSKTSDPEAKNYDEATALFLNGVELARRGDFGAAAPQIACAYLLDSRGVNFTVALPPDLPKDKETKILEYELLLKLAAYDKESVSSRVLRIMTAQYLGSMPVEGQRIIANGIMCIKWLLGLIAQDPSIEKPERGILGGCLTRTNLLRLLSTLHMAMGNRKEAMKDLTKALEIDAFYSPARVARACVWAAIQLRDNKTIHKEFKRIVSEVHEDNRGNEVSYAWLAITTLEDPSLGSFDDAKRYYEKCLRATIRRDEIYGKRKKEVLPQVLEQAHIRFQNCPGGLEFQRDLRDVIDGIGNMGEQKPSKKYSCVTCGVTKGKDSTNLMKCGRCKLVSYCSRDCQQKDWKSHKKFCKTVTSTQKPKVGATCQSASKYTERDHATQNEDPKEKVSEWVGNALASKRLEIELGTLYQKYGKGFSEWWHEKTFQEKKEVLMNVTYSTIPLKEPSAKDIRTKLKVGPNQVLSRALFDYNVETLTCTCECSGSCPHYFKEKLLHEIAAWSYAPKEKDHENLCISKEKKVLEIFPDVFGGRLAIVTPPTQEDGIFGEPAVFSEDAPDEDIQEFESFLEQGLIYDASVVHFATSRKIFALTLFIKLFDEYQYKIRRQPSINPMERLMGCRHCKGSCQGSSSIRCHVCKIDWFCGEGCMVAAGHKRCPHNGEQETKARFN